MKKNLFVVLLLATLASCDKLLDVKPKNSGVDGVVFRKTQEIQLLLNSAYDALRNDKFMGGNVWLTSELMSDNLEAGQLSDHYLALFNRSSSMFNDVARQIWNHGYMTIYRANLVLDALETAPGVRPEDLARLRGQATFLRAYCHWQLLRLFAQPWGYTADNSHPGIPLRMDVSIEPIPRSTVKAVFEQIVTDLNMAIQELPASVVPGTANVWTAKAMLAQVFFSRGEFQFALKLSRDVAENASYTFQNALNTRFAQTGSPENILELPNEASGSVITPSGAVLHQMYYSAGLVPRVFLHESYPVNAITDPADQRLKYWVHKDSTLTGIRYFCSKFNYNPVFRVPLIHLTEIKLIYAESAAEQGDLSRAALQLNDIRRRAGLTNTTLNTQQGLIQEIRNQRRIELLAEGNRLHELKRIATRDNQNVIIRKAPWNCNGLILAIPDDEVSANPLIIQNPGGGCN